MAKKNNQMADTTRNGMEPALFAQKALQAIAKEKNEVLIGGREIYGVYLKRALPGLLTRFTKDVKVR